MSADDPALVRQPGTGLLHALTIDGKGGAADIPLSYEPSPCISSGDASQRWYHFEFESPDTKYWLEQHSGLNDIATKALLNAETRPRLLCRGDRVLLTLRGVAGVRDVDADALVSIRLWTDGHTLISTRKFPLQATDEIVEELRGGVGPESIANLLVRWTERMTIDLSDVVADLEERISQVEDHLATGDINTLRVGLAQLRQETLALRRYLAPQREALARLASEAPNWFDELNRLRIRETTDRLIRYIEDIDEVRDRATIAKEDLSSRLAEQMNERSYLFTIAAVIFLPLGFLTGLFGINIGGMPGTENPQAFWMMVIACGIISIALMLWFRWRDWM